MIDSDFSFGVLNLERFSPHTSDFFDLLLIFFLSDSEPRQGGESVRASGSLLGRLAVSDPPNLG